MNTNFTTPNRGPLVTPAFRVRPCDIDTDRRFGDSFGNVETETSARWIVWLCQSLGEWQSFTFEQMQEYFRVETGSASAQFHFNRLVDPVMRRTSSGHPYPEGGGWIVKGEDGRYHITVAFVTRCFHSSPKLS